MPGSQKSFCYNFLPHRVVTIIYDFAIQNKIDGLINNLIGRNEPLPWGMSLPSIIKNINIQARLAEEIME